jgi:Tol biopolymer transport system component
MSMRAGLLAVALVLALAAPAGAASIVYTCGANLCRIDPKKPKRVTHLTRDGKRGGPRYSSPSLSADGRTLSFLRAQDLMLANRDARRARKIDNGVSLSWLSPDGRQAAFVKSISTIIAPGTTYPYYSPPVYGFVPFLFVRGASERESHTVARSIITAGWLRDRVIMAVQRDGDGVQPDDVCLAVPPEADGVCERTVATDGVRTLSSAQGSPDGRYLVAVAEPWSDARDYDQKFAGAIALFDPNTGVRLRDLTSGPADADATFSPDGKQVAFRRGHDIYVVKTAGGRAKLLRRGGSEPTWGSR